MITKMEKHDLYHPYVKGQEIQPENFLVGTHKDWRSNLIILIFISVQATYTLYAFIQ